MTVLPAEGRAVAPVLVAALLLAAIPFLVALGLPHPTAAEMLAKSEASRTQAYALMRRILAILPTLLRRPGRPTAPPPQPVDTGAISEAVLAFLMVHPGAAVTTGARHTYSDRFRHRVVELAGQHPGLDIGQLAQAVGVPAATVQDWLAAPASDPTAGASVDPVDEATHARIASVLEAWRRWSGGFSAFCTFVRTELAIDYGPTYIGSILAVHAGRRPKRRSGRSPDEKASRDALMSFFPGAQWFEDGSPITLTLNRQAFTFNWEIAVDGASAAVVGSSLRPEEDAVAVVAAFEDGVVTTGAKPLALNTDNFAANHAPEVAEALGKTLHIRTTLGRPQTDAPVEGAFGLFQQTAPPLVVDGRTDQELARAVLALILMVYCRAANHRPRKDRMGRTRVQLYRGETPTEAQIADAKAQLEERRKRQERAYQTRQARLNPIVRTLLDAVFGRLGLDDPTGNVKDAIARYPHDAVLAGVATFEGKKAVGTLPAEDGPRYLLGIVRNITERDEGLAIGRYLWQRRLAAGDAALARLEEARRTTPGDPVERVRAFIDHALEGDGPLLRSFWLQAAGEVLLHEPPDRRQVLFQVASRRIHTTFRVDPRERQTALRALAAHVLPVA